MTPAARWQRVALTALLAALVPGCQQQMASQPSLRPDEPSAFFADGRAARPSVPGTVARGHLQIDRVLFTGLDSSTTAPAPLAAALVGAPGALHGTALLLAAEQQPVAQSFPFPITEHVLRHGYQRFMIYCVVCHDALGTGHGTIVERGLTPPPSLHQERLRQAAPGHLFEVITKGYGSMPSYRYQIPVRERWAIAAYVRALQLSQHFPEESLTAALRQEWQAQSEQGGLP
jgi:mono/diheme cytochrome c family protein